MSKNIWLLQDVGKDIMIRNNIDTVKNLKFPYFTFGIFENNNQISNLENILLDPNDNYIVRGGVKILMILQKAKNLSSINSLLSEEQNNDLFLKKLKNAIFYDEYSFDQKNYNKLDLPLLNKDSHFYPIKDNLNISFTKDMFVKPSQDLKAFSPGIIPKGQKLIDFIHNGSYMNRFIEETLLVSPVKTIFSEYRFFIVGGQVVTGSQYKKDDKIIYNSHVPQEIIDVAKEFAQLYQPHEIFTMDLAQTDDGIKIVEYNCWNGSGLYHCDKIKLFSTVNDYCVDYFNRIKNKSLIKHSY